MKCWCCDAEAAAELWELAGIHYVARNGGRQHDRCPNCEEPLEEDHTDYDYYEPEPEISPLDEFVQEVFQPGDEETLSG